MLEDSGGDEVKPNPSYGDVLTIKEFAGHVESGFFTDYDGSGYWSDGRQCDTTVRVYPSEYPAMQRPAWATHVIWFNK